MLDFTAPTTILHMTSEHVITANRMGKMRLLDPASADVHRTFIGQTAKIEWIESCSELKLIITGGADSRTRAWALTSGKCVHTFNVRIICAAVHKHM